MNLIWSIVAYIVFSCLWSLYYILSSKNKKLALKEQVNFIVILSEISIIFVFMVTMVFAIFGCETILTTSDNELILVIVRGMEVSLYIISYSVLLVFLIDIVKKKGKGLGYAEYFKKLEIQGIWRYTEEEKDYIKKRDDEAKAKLRERFPILKRLSKKDKKDAI